MEKRATGALIYNFFFKVLSWQPFQSQDCVGVSIYQNFRCGFNLYVFFTAPFEEIGKSLYFPKAESENCSIKSVEIPVKENPPSWNKFCMVTIRV